MYLEQQDSESVGSNGREIPLPMMTIGIGQTTGYTIGDPQFAGVVQR